MDNDQSGDTDERSGSHSRRVLTDQQRRELYQIASDPTLQPARKVERLLEMGRRVLGFENGHVVTIDGNRHEVAYVAGSDLVSVGTISNLEETYCSLTIERDDILVEAGPADAPGIPEKFDDIKHYVGSTLVVNGETYGTVCFVSSSERTTEITGAERAFVDLLTRWISQVLEAKHDEYDRWRQRELLQLFVEEVSDYAIFMLDPKGYVETWNVGAHLLTGYEETEIIGQHFSTFYTDADREQDVPATLLEQAKIDGRVEHEGWRVRNDGSRFWALVTITALYDDDNTLRGFGKITRDLTDQREFERELRREKQFTERAIDTLDDLFFVLTLEGQIERINEQVCTLTGYNRRTLYEMSITDLVVAEQEADVNATLQTIVNQGEQRFNVTLLTKEHERRQMEFRSCRFLDTDGHVRGIVSIGRDVTDQQLESERLEVAQRLLRHNLRNDLNAIRGWVEILADTTDPDQDDALDRIITITDRLVDLSEKTRKMVALESHADGTRIDLATYLPEFIEGKRQLFPEATIELTIGGQGPWFVENGEHFDTAISNIIENAVEHNSAATPWAGIQVRQINGEVELRVADDGPGIPEHEQQVLDEGGETALEHGSGVGLWLIYWGVTTMGGEVSFESRDPEGSLVRVSIPVMTNGSEDP